MAKTKCLILTGNHCYLASVMDRFWRMIFTISCRASVLVSLALLLLGCDGRVPGMKEQANAPVPEALKPYPALLSVDRTEMGFPPLPNSGTVRILTVDREHWNQGYPPPNYDVSFQFYGLSNDYHYTSRFVALKSVAQAQTWAGDRSLLKWVGEQMLFHGPKFYTSAEQQLPESIDIANEIEQISVVGADVRGTHVHYSGPDKRLSPRGEPHVEITLEQAGPVLREWGYDFKADLEQQKAAKPSPDPGSKK